MAKEQPEFSLELLSGAIGQDRPGSVRIGTWRGTFAKFWRSLREMGFGIRAMVQELSGTLDALQDKPEPIGHALELARDLRKRLFPAIPGRLLEA